MNEEELTEFDRQFVPELWSNRSPRDKIGPNHINNLTKQSLEIEKRIPNQLNIKYGTDERNFYSIFGTDLAYDAPCLVFIHGGYWSIKEASAELYYCLSKNFYSNGIKTIFIEYELCPKVTIAEVVKNVENALDHCLKSLKSKKFYFVGHSAGAHLIASLFINFIEKLENEQQNRIKDIFLISGCYNLIEISQSFINERLHLTPTTAKLVSPLFNKFYRNVTTKIYLFVGEYESPLSMKFSKEFYDKLIKMGFDVELKTIENCDHFQLVEDLFCDDFVLTKFILNKITFV